MAKATDRSCDYCSHKSVCSRLCEMELHVQKFAGAVSSMGIVNELVRQELHKIIANHCKHFEKTK